MTKQFQELLLERQEIDSKFEEWHSTFQQEVIAKDQVNKKLLQEIKELRERFSELEEAGEQKDLQIRELNLLRDSTQALLKNNELQFEIDDYQEYEESISISPNKAAQELPQDNSICMFEDNDVYQRVGSVAQDLLPMPGF